MAHFPPDRFDEVPEDLERVGAHRAPRRPGQGWIAFAWAALATGVIVAAGVTAMFVIDDRVSFDNPFTATAPTPTPTPTPTVEPTLDPAINLVVLNSTQTDGLATTVGDELAAEGWSVGTRGNADSEIAETTVYYVDAAQEGAAKGVVQSLGVGRIQQSDAFALEGETRLVAVLGTDYPVPAEG